LAVLLLAAPAARGVEKGAREPIVVTANRMEADKLGDTVTFLGDVVLKKEAMTMNADELLVYYDQPAKGVREIEARGNVVVTQEGRVALANHAVYYSAEEKIVLTGDARVIENENQVGGERITLFMRDERSIIEGGRVLIYQEQKEGSAVPPLQKAP
jgi:lipopolysaccharide export system protein LptA